MVAAGVTMVKAFRRSHNWATALRRGFILFLAIAFGLAAFLTDGGHQARAASREGIPALMTQAGDCADLLVRMPCDNDTQRGAEHPCDSGHCLSSLGCFLCAPLNTAWSWRTLNGETVSPAASPVPSSAELRRQKRPPRSILVI
ncbi:hypothetical protein AGR2A_pa40074 [Agrobacterium genomosp. 2 str. CFBP 5494]|uniref:Uncharacterized protein n=1 Tax=Agrobacterium genomosp. 2 str. CFBP 5494 TaxID=1183436 RepID=A0A9W5F3F4_9HYPH|nr:hypothetical protein RP007_05206 [Rhizobium sp. P007]CUX02100.1 hypothetical protein AGR2A_pa40074 [Agrobacterium genomosp. 2 str. CFBP 5494]